MAAPEVWQCRICGHRAVTEPQFQAHLTATHFRDRIIRRIRPPYRCLLCSYLAPATLSEPDKVEGKEAGSSNLGTFSSLTMTEPFLF